MKLSKWKHAIGMGWLFTTYICFVFTFVVAYFTPEKAVIFDINSYGEAHIEMILTIITFPIIIWHLAKTMKLVKYSQG